MRRTSLFEVLKGVDQSVALRMNRTARVRGICRFFEVVSKLGDGKFWYTLIILLPLVHGVSGMTAAAHMLTAGGLTLCVYKAVKLATQRPRPCAVSSDFLTGTMPLDEYSFPSGHTMHAVAFAYVACSWWPGLIPILLPFTVLIAVSRPVLGLHYPTDVVLGAALGLLTARLSFLLFTPVPFS